MSSGYNNESIFDNLGMTDYQSDKQSIENFIVESVNNNNYQTFIVDPNNETETKSKTTQHINVKNKKKNINDILKDNVINKSFLGGLTVIGLYVVFQLIKKSR